MIWAFVLFWSSFGLGSCAQSDLARPPIAVRKVRGKLVRYQEVAAKTLPMDWGEQFYDGYLISAQDDSLEGRAVRFN